MYITNEKARVFESDNATFWAIIDKSKLKNNVDVIIEHQQKMARAIFLFFKNID